MLLSAHNKFGRVNNGLDAIAYDECSEHDKNASISYTCDASYSLRHKSSIIIIRHLLFLDVTLQGIVHISIHMHDESLKHKPDKSKQLHYYLL